MLLFLNVNRQIAFAVNHTYEMVLKKSRGRLADFLGLGRSHNGGSDERELATQSLPVRVLGKAANEMVVPAPCRV